MPNFGTGFHRASAKGYIADFKPGSTVELGNNKRFTRNAGKANILGKLDNVTDNNAGRWSGYNNARSCACTRTCRNRGRSEVICSGSNPGFGEAHLNAGSSLRSHINLLLSGG
jgi:hypothetical protein